MGRAAFAADVFLASIGEKPLVMGILNVTPDSFSDGGQFADVERALAHAQEMAQAGADVLDIGAEFDAARLHPGRSGGGMGAARTRARPFARQGASAVGRHQQGFGRAPRHGARRRNHQ